MKLTKTGWEDIDALFSEVERVHNELEVIREECKDILYPSGKKKPDNPDVEKLLVRSA
ncbi:hypothetical protein Theco_4098 (plasmid) [Thermobacillus composti KWC4]|jgi:uncharacterized protein (UPF0335 family)|uniref:Uncharacterized protein n=1 Tax=Thermobacillus composti (strain DSM 18247 / JCM 13945 / KWC4) TaxID=717605 RepID=L0ELC5_THECK|nr:hypothetical protein [Thermobacillus composti]AGA60095.1 hypothetical protein Theco_4098 [Thermobacillus composti KWC4]